MKKITVLLAFMLMCAFINAQTADEIIEKHIEKTGGIKAWKAIKSIKTKSILRGRGQKFKTICINTPKEFYYGTEYKGGLIFVEEAFDGETVWGSNQETMEVEEKDESALKKAKLGCKEFPSVYITYKKLGYTFKLLGEEKIEGIDCYKLELIEGNKDIDKSIQFFSKKDYMLIARETKEKNKSGGFNINYKIFSDFKEEHGVIFCHSIEKTLLSQTRSLLYRCTLEILSYKINSKIDKSIFEFEEPSI
jgi:outer membrane lipoprotein-sorting protein